MPHESQPRYGYPRSFLTGPALALTLLLTLSQAMAGIAPQSPSLPAPESHTTGQAYLIAGIQAFDFQDFATADTLLSQALEARDLAQENRATALLYRAACRNMLGDFDLMLLDAQALIQLRPDDATPHVMKGQALFGLAMWDQAIMSFTRAVKLSPRDPSTYHFRADAWAAQGDVEKALADYRQALNADPGYYPAALERARLWRSQGRPDMAVQDLDLVLDILPDHPQILYLRGLCYKEMGEDDLAREDMDRALALDPGVADKLDRIP